MKTFSLDRKSLSEIPEGFDSLVARGNVGPNFAKSVILPNGVKIPTEMRPRCALFDFLHLTLFSHSNRYWQNPSEYIVPNPDQVRIRYLIQFSR